MTDRILAPCPHPFKTCGPGWTAQIVRIPRSVGGSWWHVACRSCGLETPFDSDEDGAITRWNEAPRAEEAPNGR